MSPDEAKRRARQAIAVTCALYVAYAGLRVVLPYGSVLGFLLVAAFYFLPGLMLRDRPDIAEEDQVGPDTPIPRWSWRGARVAGLAALIVFPIFALVNFWFYADVCTGDLTPVQPVLWVESFTPFEGRLESFLGRMCRNHGGGFFPEALVLPERWTRWYGGGFLLECAVMVFAVAMPEEVFHRGYLMSALERRWPPKRKVLGVPFGWAAILSSVLFAVGHLVGLAETARLATFFPALIFAWLWRRSGSLWAPALFHTASNLLMDLLLASTLPAP